LLEPACVAAHERGTLWTGKVEGGVGGSPASCVLSTLCEGEAGRRGEGSVAADLPGALRGAVGLRWRAALLLTPPLVWGGRAGSRGEGRVSSSSEGGDILPLGRLAMNWLPI
jgi:hypothetical protein